PQLPPLPERPEDPYERRPVCEGLFLTSEWRLSPKQKACDWVQNRVFSTSALAGAVWSASTTPIWEEVVGQKRSTDGFPKRFGTNFAQNAFKSTGAYLGAMIQHEDPRQVPPFLVLRGATTPHGFGKRVWHALVVNLTAYECVRTCVEESDI